MESTRDLDNDDQAWIESQPRLPDGYPARGHSGPSMPIGRRINRRSFLVKNGTLGLLALAGCLGADDQAAVNLDPPVAGDPEGPVIIQVFSDFACPHCRRFQLDEFPQLERGLLAGGGVRYEHRDYPIPVDPEWSWTAANAARAVQVGVGDESFWAYSKQLYEYQGRLSMQLISELADRIGADGPTVRREATSAAYQVTITRDRDLGNELGIPGTPAVLVDGQLVSPSATEIERIASL